MIKKKQTNHHTPKPRRPAELPDYMGLGRDFWLKVLDIDTDWVMIECNLGALIDVFLAG